MEPEEDVCPRCNGPIEFAAEEFDEEDENLVHTYFICGECDFYFVIHSYMEIINEGRWT